ncbi:glycoside hydrolase family 15 [Candidatus Woesearchaeota archaeon]|nr:glycoside hydrolase family 15 [Candidatus Woesearchaeota archaeon]
MIKKLLSKTLSKRILKSLQYPSGLFGASKKRVKTGYNKAWIRDNIYESLGLMAAKDIKSLKKTYYALFDVLLKHEYKIDWAIKEKPDAAYKYIHARYCPHTFNEFYEVWGNKQNDAVGAFLFMVGTLFREKIIVFRDLDDLRILQKLVKYLESIEYWHDPDNGIWENEEEVHASSIGACLAGLKAVTGLVNVPDSLIKKGETALNTLLPKESKTKDVDLALLSLIYPFDIVTVQQRALILKNVEEKLVRKKGIIRYFNDYYYKNQDKEAEWCFGFIWLAKIYRDLRNEEKYRYYINKTHECMNWKCEIPELYYGGSKISNKNTPLGWSQALYLVAVA